MMDNNDLFNDNTSLVIAELADFFGKFSELLSMELSEEARNIVQLTLCDLLHGNKNDEVTINNDDCHCPVDDELPNEYAQSQRSKPVETPKPEYSKMFDGYADLMDGSNKRITGKRLYEKFTDYVRSCPGFKMGPANYLTSIIDEELTQIGYGTENEFLYAFLMNACHVDFSKHFFDGEPGDNPFTMEMSIKEQFGVDPKLDTILHTNHGKTIGHDLSRSALLGLPVYRDGSMPMMSLLSYYCGLISEFMIEAAKY